MNKKIIRCISIAVTTLVLLTLVCGCDDNKDEIENLISKFEHSCNELNISAMLDCVDPQISDKIKLATGVAGALADKSSNELLNSFSGMITGDTSLNSGEFFSSVKIELSGVKTTKESGTADAIVEYKIAGQNFRKEAVFEFIYSMKKWYISSFRFK